MEEDEINLSDLAVLVLGHRDQPNRRGGHWIKRGHSKKVTSVKNEAWPDFVSGGQGHLSYVVTWPDSEYANRSDLTGPFLPHPPPLRPSSFTPIWPGQR